MTFLEAALQVLGRERKPLHFKEITEMAVGKKLLTFVGRTPEVTMQTQLTASVKKAPGNPFVRVKPGVFGLLRYPDVVEPEVVVPAVVTPAAQPSPRATARAERAEGAEASADEAPRGRRSRRGRRGGRDEGDERPSAEQAASAPAATERVASEDSQDSQAPQDLPEPRFNPPSDLGATPSSTSRGGSPRRGSSVPTGLSAAGDEASSAAPAIDSADGDDEGEGEGEGEAGLEDGTESAGDAGDGEALARRRRRRRRRRRGGADGGGLATEATSAPAPFPADFRGPPEGMGDDEAPQGEPADNESRATQPQAETASSDVPPSSEGHGDPRRIMAPVDAAIEILRGQAPGRGVHVRQIADAAVRRRLVHGESHEAWRVIRAALAAEGKERLRAGVRPRIRAAGSGLFALARRPADLDLEKAEHIYGEAVRALRERTLASLELRLGELASGAFEALARVLLQREGFGPATFVKRVEGTVYVEALRGRGWKPSKCLVGLRWGATPAGRRAVGELRAGVRARSADEGVLLLAGRLAEEAIREWKQPGPPIEVVDGPAMAEACGRHGVGVITAQVNVDFVDADFFAELAEG